VLNVKAVSHDDSHFVTLNNSIPCSDSFQTMGALSSVARQHWSGPVSLCEQEDDDLLQTPQDTFESLGHYLHYLTSYRPATSGETNSRRKLTDNVF